MRQSKKKINVRQFFRQNKLFEELKAESKLMSKQLCILSYCLKYFYKSLIITISSFSVLVQNQFINHKPQKL